MARIAIIDLETTGDKPDEGDVPIEAAVVILNDQKQSLQWHSLLNPGDQPIHPCASASHHITTSMLKHMPQLKPAFWQIMVEDCDYIAAHVAAFDRAFLPELNKPWICTHRCALHLYPDAPRHSLQVLRYHLNLQPKIPRNLYPHRALYDAQCTVALLQAMLQQRAADELHALTTAPLLFTQVRFGKHRGTPWAELPMDYLHWILRQDFDEDTKHTARHWIAETRRSQSSVPEVPEQLASS